MKKSKIGSLYRVLRDNGKVEHGYEVGDLVYLIECTKYDDNIYVNDDGLEQYVHPSDVELCLNIGQIVKVVNNSSSHNFNLGEYIKYVGRSEWGGMEFKSIYGDIKYILPPKDIMEVNIDGLQNI